MKRTLLLATVVAASFSLSAQTTEVRPSTARFLENFRAFADSIPADAVRADSIYHSFEDLYRTIYKDSMDSSQRSVYEQIRGTYTRQIVSRKASRVAGQVDSVGTGIADGVRNGVNQGVGFIKGLLGK